MQYRDNMTVEEKAQLLAECNALDAMYADAYARDNEAKRDTDEEEESYYYSALIRFANPN